MQIVLKCCHVVLFDFSLQLLFIQQLIEPVNEEFKYFYAILK